MEFDAYGRILKKNSHPYYECFFGKERNLKVKETLINYSRNFLFGTLYALDFLRRIPVVYLDFAKLKTENFQSFIISFAESLHNELDRYNFKTNEKKEKNKFLPYSRSC